MDQTLDVPSLTQLREDLWSIMGRPREPALRRETTALLCLDLQRLDAHRDFGIGARARAVGRLDFLEPYWERVEQVVLPNVIRLQHTARACRVEVIHARVATVTLDARDNTARYKAMGSGCPYNTKEAEFIAEVAPHGDEIVVNKVTSSPFNSTNIDRLLRNLGVETLIVVGLATNCCVESTVRNAAELDYGVYLVEDGTATFSPELHAYSVLSMGSKDAAVKSTDEMIAMLEALPAPKLEERS